MKLENLNKVDFILVVTEKKRNDAFAKSISSNKKAMIFLDYLIYKKLMTRIFTFRTGDLENNNAFVYVPNVQFKTIRKHLKLYKFIVDSNKPI